MQRGFSLLELLLVLAILGVLLVIGGVSLINASRQARVQEGAVQLAADLQRARSTAQRSNQDANVRLTVGSDSYTVTLAGVAQPRRLPQGIIVRELTGSSSASSATIGYSAPHGELTGTMALRVTLGYGAQTSVQPRYVKVVGVTGKVITSATP